MGGALHKMQVDGNSSMEHSFNRGEAIWYRSKSGSLLPAKVDSVDLTVSPVSYAIILEGSDHYRETESPRLLHRLPGVPPPSAAAAGSQTANKEDLQLVPQAGQTPPEAAGSEVDWRATTWRPHTAKAAFSKPQKQGSNSHLRVAKPHTVKAAFKPPAAESSDDEFGEFFAADGQNPEVLPQEAQTRMGPIPLSIFGEEESHEPSDLEVGTTQQREELSSNDEHSFSQPPQYAPSPAALVNQGRGTLQPQVHQAHSSLPYVTQQLEAASTPLAHPGFQLGQPGAGQAYMLTGQPPVLAALRNPALADSSIMTGSGIGLGSPAALSDNDFGDFEEAPGHDHEREAQPSEAAGTRWQGGQPEHPVPAHDSSAGSSNPTRPVAASGAQAASAVPSAAVRSLAERFAGARLSHSPQEPVESEEIPWYLDPGSQIEAAAVEEPLAAAWQANGIGTALPAGPPPHLGGRPLPSGFIDDIAAVEEPEAAGWQANGIGTALPAGPPPHLGGRPLPSGFIDNIAAVEEPEAAAWQANGISTALPAGLLPRRAGLPAQLNGLPPQIGGRPVLSELIDREGLQQAALQRGLAPANSRQAPPEVGYPEAWAQMAQACAIELERGRQILQQVAARGSADRFLVSRQGHEFLQALGQLFLASQILEAAMGAHVQEAERPPTFSDSLHRCSQAWAEGELAVGDAVARVAPLARQQSLELPRQAAEALSLQRQSRGPQWQDGLCGVCLLPLKSLQQLHVMPWLEERPCLVLLANLWTHRVHGEAPRLRGW